MAFPLTPANNQVALVNGIEYYWLASKGAWYRYGDVTANVITSNTFQVLSSVVFSDGTSQTTAATGIDSYARTTANTNSNNITIIQGVDTTQNTNITTATNAAQAAFAQANATAGGLISANSRLTIAEGVDVGQNTRMTIIEGVDTTQNTNITIADSKAQAAFDKANAANSLAQAAYNQANTGGGGTLDQFARDTANSASSNTIIIQGVNTTQNTNITIADSKAQAAFDKANAANSLAQAAYNQANTGGGGTLDQFARDTANGANGLAAGAFDKANTSITTSGGTITGSLNVSQELTVTGNLTVLGATTTINTSFFTVTDSLIQLATGNYTSDLLDIGISGHYNDGTNAHTGFIRDPETKEWYVFKGYTPEVGNNNININDASFAKANVHADYFKGNVIANTITGNVSIATNSSAANSIGYLGVPQSNLNPMSSSYTLTIGDSGEHLYMVPSSSALTVNIPPNSSVPFPIGTAIVTVLDAAFKSNVVPQTGVTLRLAGNTAGSNVARTLSEYSMASLIKVGTDAWYISGAGVT